MSEITSVETQKKDKTRCSIYIDGAFYCGIKLEVAVKYRLKAGMHIEKSELDAIQLETEKSQAVDKAMTHLSASMKTQKQMRDFLEKKGYSPAVCDYVLEKLRYYNLIDDVQYCRVYINGAKGKGKRALQAELIKRGADRRAIDNALGDFEENCGEALLVLQKYMRGKENSRENILKGYKYLLSKGFGYDTAKSAAQAFGECDEDY